MIHAMDTSIKTREQIWVNVSSFTMIMRISKVIVVLLLIKKVRSKYTIINCFKNSYKINHDI